MSQFAQRIVLLTVVVLVAPALAGDPIVITGDEQRQLDMARGDGGLPASPGMTNIQVFRASRAAPQLADGKGWTYNHHVDLACWQGRLYLAWNSCEKDEDVYPSRELYSTSSDGFTWSQPAELFPQGVSTALRMFFFRAPNGRMLALAGLRTTTDPMIERKKGPLVVREIGRDHALGPVHLLRPPSDANRADLPPRFQTAEDKGFVEACRQLLANKPFLEQSDYGLLLDDRKMKWHDASTWPADEPSREHFPNRFGKGTSFFHRADGALVALMKWGWVLVSRDEGETWSSPVRPPTLVSGMAKTWGQRTSDGRYALLYNPHLAERYPLVIVRGDDGVTFSSMQVVHGELPPLRYPGLYKVVGPQYVRGISEWSTDGSRKDSAMWVAYSVGKEDIWVSRIPVGGDANNWNLYSPKWAPATVSSDKDGNQIVELEDRDPADFARATRLLKPTPKADVQLEVKPDKSSTVPLHVSLAGPRGVIAAELHAHPEGTLTAGQLRSAPASGWIRIRFVADAEAKTFTLIVSDQEVGRFPLAERAQRFDAVSFRTGDRKPLAAPETEDRPLLPSRYSIRNLVTR